MVPKPCPNPRPGTPFQNNNPLTRKAPGPKMTENKSRTRVPAKRRYKVRVIAQPLPTTPSTYVHMNPIPSPRTAISNASTQILIVKSAATSIPVTVYNVAQGKFEGNPYLEGRPQVEENSSTPNCNPPQPEAAPMPQPLRSEKTPLGLTPCQPPHIYSKQGQIGQFPLCQHPL